MLLRRSHWVAMALAVALGATIAVLVDDSVSATATRDVNEAFTADNSFQLDRFASFFKNLLRSVRAASDAISVSGNDVLPPASNFSRVSTQQPRFMRVFHRVMGAEMQGTAGAGAAHPARCGRPSM